jgi:hypothetical protein
VWEPEDFIKKFNGRRNSNRKMEDSYNYPDIIVLFIYLSTRKTYCSLCSSDDVIPNSRSALPIPVSKATRVPLREDLMITD